MRYFLLASLLALMPATARAINAPQSQGSCQSETRLAQGRCYQVAAWMPPDMLSCQQVGTTDLGIPIWLCC